MPAAGSYLARRIGLDRQGVDLRFHHRTERVVHHAMAGLHGLAREPRRHYSDPVVPAAVARAFMAGVVGGLVQDLERFGSQPGELLLDANGYVAHSGLSSACRASTSACSTTNTSSRPVAPNSLKFTQASVEN